MCNRNFESSTLVLPKRSFKVLRSVVYSCLGIHSSPKQQGVLKIDTFCLHEFLQSSQLSSCLLGPEGVGMDSIIYFNINSSMILSKGHI